MPSRCLLLGAAEPKKKSLRLVHEGTSTQPHPCFESFQIKKRQSSHPVITCRAPELGSEGSGFRKAPFSGRIPTDRNCHAPPFYSQSLQTIAFSRKGPQALTPNPKTPNALNLGVGSTIIYYGICATHRGPSVTAPLQQLLQFRYSSVAPPLQLPLELRYNSVAPPLQLPLQFRYSFRYSSVAAPLQLRCTSVTAPLQLPCTSVTAPLQLPLQLHYSSVAPPLQLRDSFRYSFRDSSATAPLQLRCTSAAAPLQLPLQLSYTAPLQLRYISVAAPPQLPLQLSCTAPLQFRYSSVIKLLLLLRLRYSFRYSIAAAGSPPLQPSDTTPLQLRDKSVTAPLLSVTVSVTSPVTSPVTGEHFCHSRGLQMMVEPRPNPKP